MSRLLSAVRYPREVVSMPISPSAGPGPSGFQPAFFKRRTPAPVQEAAAPAHPRGPRARYHADRDGSHARFCEGSRFTRYREEVRENVAYIAALCAELEMPDAADIEQRFLTFYSRRFEKCYFDYEDLPLIDSAGKRSLDNFCAMLGNPRLRAPQKAAAIRDLSLGLVVCASGTTANLIAADRNLSLSTGSLLDRLWLAKDDLVRNVLLEAVYARYGNGKHAIAWELHRVYNLWNGIADEFGLCRIPHHPAENADPELLVSCRQKVLEALTPDRIVAPIADECLAMFRDRALADPQAISGRLDEGRLAFFHEVLDDIRRHTGLSSDQLDLHVFIELADEGDGYRVRDDASLIAVELLRIMDTHGLLAGAPARLFELVERDRWRVEVFLYGDRISWCLHRALSAGDVASWQDHRDAEALDASVLHAWPWAEGPDAAAPPRPAIRQALRGDDPPAVMAIQARWLGSAQDILDALGRLDAEQAARYLGRNLPYLLSDFPVAEREALIRGVMHLGEPAWVLAREWYSELTLVTHLPAAAAARYLRDHAPSLLANVSAELRGDWMDKVMHLGEAAHVLARAWYADAWTLLTEKRDGRRITRWEYWIRTDNIDALDSVHALLMADWPALGEGRARAVPVDPPERRYDAWCTDREGRLALSKNPDTVHAAHRVLRRLCAGAPGVDGRLAGRLAPWFPFRLARLLAAADAPTKEAFRAMLVDPALLPHIVEDLPFILSGDAPYRGYPASQVLAAGDAAVVRAYGDLLADMVAAFRAGPWLVGLLLGKWPSPPTSVKDLFGSRDGRDSYSLANVDGADVIAAYRDVLVHPAILPHIAHALPELVLGAPSPDARRASKPWPRFQRKLLDRLFDATRPGHAAYVDMARDPAILPHILQALPPGCSAIQASLAGTEYAANEAGPGFVTGLRKRMDRLFRRAGV
ncbi:hypothetical protein ACL598_14475 [Bordetella bronchialis]|uniref:hypothetical protein n=1 Tax=Bordetella bronchialis TaxID=463025 RepID=UPI003D00F6CA